ncbi:MAG: nucleotide exchange factor GrpE, partial [Chloroflexota bacterium]|nr:nucleotide exchange factor GrpE [Chloroflexota bacterium]
MMDFEAAGRIERLRGEMAAARSRAAERIRALEAELERARSETVQARAETAEARGQAAENEQKYLRSLAEMENFRKRLERSHAELAKTSKKALFTKALLVLDNLGRAMDYEH